MPERLYLELLKKSLTRVLVGPERTWRPLPPGTKRIVDAVLRVPPARRLAAARLRRFFPGETMLPLERLDHLQACIRQIVDEEIPGDVIETGVWRGGATIFMRGALEAYGDKKRVVWVADSFEGLPKPKADLYPEDEGDRTWTLAGWLAVPLTEVKANFERYGLLDERVRFLPGWFSETLPDAPIERLSLLRLDGDIYESTIVALRALYPKVSPGGFVIVDDYGAVSGCRAAVEDFRSAEGITEPLEAIDWSSVCWRKQRGASVTERASAREARSAAA